jgi:CheY-like chemotaxis protein
MSSKAVTGLYFISAPDSLALEGYPPMGTPGVRKEASQGFDLSAGEARQRHANNLQGGVPTLQRSKPANATNRATEIKGESDTRPQKTGKLLRILVVEDNRDAADSLRLMLELYGYDVKVAYSGPDGVQAAKQCQPDVVLCDIGLPGLDGYGVARMLRDNPATARAHLIAVTAFGQDEDRRRSYEAGFEHHLVKPVDPDALLRVLKSLSHPEAASPAQRSAAPVSRRQTAVEQAPGKECRQ